MGYGISIKLVDCIFMTHSPETASIGKEEARRLILSGRIEVPRLVLHPEIETVENLDAIVGLPSIDTGGPYVIYDFKDKTKGFPKPKSTKEASAMQETDATDFTESEIQTGLAIGEILTLAADTQDKATFQAELNRVQQLANDDSSTDTGILLPSKDSIAVFSFQPKPDMTPGQRRRAIVFGELVRNIDTWQLALQQGNTPTAVIDNADGTPKERTMVITQAIVDRLKRVAFDIYDNELSSSPKAKALADAHLEAQLPQADAVFDAIDYQINPGRREAEMTAQNAAFSHIFKETEAYIAEQEAKEAQRLRNKIRSWIKKGRNLFSKNKPKENDPDIKKVGAQDAVHFTNGQEVKNNCSIDTPSEEASKYIEDLMDRDL